MKRFWCSFSPVGRKAICYKTNTRQFILKQKVAKISLCVSRVEQAQTIAHDTRREWGHSPSNLSYSANKKRTFVYRQRCVFWMMFPFGKWWRLRLMLFSSRMMCALRHIEANIASLRHKVAQHHFEQSEKHHIAAGDASLLFADRFGLAKHLKCL